MSQHQSLQLPPQQALEHGRPFQGADSLWAFSRDPSGKSIEKPTPFYKLGDFSIC
jgi:hypothetical protein